MCPAPPEDETSSHNSQWDSERWQTHSVGEAKTLLLLDSCLVDLLEQPGVFP